MQTLMPPTPLDLDQLVDLYNQVPRWSGRNWPYSKRLEGYVGGTLIAVDHKNAMIEETYHDDYIIEAIDGKRLLGRKVYSSQMKFEQKKPKVTGHDLIQKLHERAAYAAGVGVPPKKHL
jgi:hypothetical protein